MAISFVGQSAFTSGTAAITVPAPTGGQTGDFILLLVNTANQTLPSVPTLNGVAMTAIGSGIGTGTAGAIGAVSIYAYYAFRDTVDYSAAVGDSGSYQAATMIYLRGVDATTPISGTAVTRVDSAATTTLTLPTISPTGNQWGIQAIGLDLDAATDPYTVFTSLTTSGTFANLIKGGTTTTTGAVTNAGVGGGLWALGYATGASITAGTFAASTTHAYMGMVLNAATPTSFDDQLVAITGQDSSSIASSVSIKGQNDSSISTDSKITGTSPSSQNQDVAITGYSVISRVNATTQTLTANTTHTVSLGWTTTPGNALVVFVESRSTSATTTVTATGATFTQEYNTAAPSGTSIQSANWAVNIGSAVSSITITSSASVVKAVTIIEYAGVADIAAKDVSGSLGVAASTTMVGRSLTTTNPHDVVLNVVGHSGNTGTTLASAGPTTVGGTLGTWSSVGNISNNGGNNGSIGIAVAEQIVFATGTYSAQWTSPTSTGYTSGGLALEAAVYSYMEQNVRVDGTTVATQTQDVSIKSSVNVDLLQNVALQAQATSFASQNTALTAQNIDTQTQDTKIFGYFITNQTQSTSLIGQNDSFINQTAKVISQNTVNVTTDTKIIGQNSSFAVQNIKQTGQADSFVLQSGSIIGKDYANFSQSSYITGQNSTSTSSNVSITGKYGLAFSKAYWGLQDVVVSAKLTTSTALQMGVFARFVDVTNFYTLMVEGTSITAYRVINGEFVSLGTSSGFTNGDLIKLYLAEEGSSTRVIAYRNNSMILDTSDSTAGRPSGLEVGILNSETAYFDDFSAILPGSERDVSITGRTSTSSFTTSVVSTIGQAVAVDSRTVSIYGRTRIKVWNGSQWVEKTIKVYNGSQWIVKQTKVWTGTQWMVVG